MELPVLKVKVSLGLAGFAGFPPLRKTSLSLWFDKLTIPSKVEG
jgi:hypothetical protein